MKKRTILSIILTIICVIATNKFWLVFKPMPVRFNINGNGEYKIQVVLNKKDNSEFKKTKSASETVNLSGYEDVVKFDVYRSKFPKRLKLVIASESKTGGGKLLAISEFYVRKQKVNFSNIKDFSVKNAKIEIKNNKLYITPLNNEKIEIIYNILLNAKCSVKFEFGILLSIMILSFLLFLKLTSYLADFKNVKNQSRIEIVFLTIFFVFLFVPMSHINQDETSKTENRTLAKKPIFITQNGEINDKYGKDFDSWFNDRFSLRQDFLNCYTIINFINRSITLKDSFFIKKNKWLGFKYSLKFKNEKSLKEAINYLNDLYAFCYKNQIKLYVLLVPEKESIYIEELTPFVSESIVKKNNEDIKYIINHSKANIIYPYEDFRKQKSNYLFFKTEHHWTQYGAYIGFLDLMSKIKQDFPIKSIISLNDYEKYYDKRVNAAFNRKFRMGTTLSRMPALKGYSDEILDVNYSYYKNKNEKFLKETIIDSKRMQGREFSYIKGYPLKVVQVGTSMNECLDNFLPYQFENVKYIRLNFKHVTSKEQSKILKYYKNDILNYKPDIMVFCITLNNLKNYKEIK